MQAEAAVLVVEDRLVAEKLVHPVVELALFARLGDARLEDLDLSADLVLVVAQRVGLLEQILGVGRVHRPRRLERRHRRRGDPARTCSRSDAQPRIFRIDLLARLAIGPEPFELPAQAAELVS